MAISVWDPFTALARLDPEFDELVRRAWSGTTTGRQAATAGFVPAVEMSTDGSDVVITLELPGVDVDSDVEIEVTEGRLAISGRRRETEERSDRRNVLVRELRYGAFRREFALPQGVTADQVEASYDKGMLSVRVRDVAKPPTTHKVPISRAAEASSPKQVTQGESA